MITCAYSRKQFICFLVFSGKSDLPQKSTDFWCFIVAFTTRPAMVKFHSWLKIYCPAKKNVSLMTAYKKNIDQAEVVLEI